MELSVYALFYLCYECCNYVILNIRVMDASKNIYLHEDNCNTC